MKNIYLLIMAFLIIVIAGYFFQFKQNDKAPYKISADEAAKMIEGNQDIIVVDVRTLEEYQQGHIKNAKLLPLTDLEEKAGSVLPDKGKIILVYCRSGRRSSVAADILFNSGYENVYDFGGMNSWKGEIVKD